MNTHPKRERFRSAYEGQPPWDLGRPQKPFVDIADQITGSVLDAGCGTGNNALFFAQRGPCVLGIDFVEFPISDHLAGGGRDKEYHDRGQDESEVEYLINRLTRAGDLIVDPFCGGGAIPAACKSLGRRWLAAEIDKTTALIARRRLGEMQVDAHHGLLVGC